MAEVKTEQEPSIEEILESIRQIISEDSEDAAAKPVLDKLEGAKEPAIVPSDLNLAQKLQAPVPPSNLSLTPTPAPAAPPPVPLSLKPEPPAQPVDNKPAPLDLTDKVAPGSPVTIEMMDSPMTEPDKASSLMSPETAATVTDSLSKILSSNIAIETERSGSVGKVTLEDMARDLMKPLIKTWLDQNLPGIIDKAVQKEVEKLSRRAMDR